ncbi:hypothetical protein PY257_13975 [Ramlibacter sp. H39-3-26]|nr:hypothetical protein [Ramlibacter sp. H39-3-26]MDF1486271.1 hypothetical protein [Ramlibacter sp. H39-3-26]
MPPLPGGPGLPPSLTRTQREAMQANIRRPQEELRERGNPA